LEGQKLEEKKKMKKRRRKNIKEGGTLLKKKELKQEESTRRKKEGKGGRPATLRGFKIPEGRDQLKRRKKTYEATERHEEGIVLALRKKKGCGWDA